MCVNFSLSFIPYSYLWSDPEVSFKKEKKYDAIIVAVGHKKFKELSQNDYESISLDEPVLIDIKEIIENLSWRL